MQTNIYTTTFRYNNPVIIHEVRLSPAIHKNGFVNIHELHNKISDEFYEIKKLPYINGIVCRWPKVSPDMEIEKAVTAANVMSYADEESPNAFYAIGIDIDNYRIALTAAKQSADIGCEPRFVVFRPFIAQKSTVSLNINIRGLTNYRKQNGIENIPLFASISPEIYESKYVKINLSIMADYSADGIILDANCSTPKEEAIQEIKSHSSIPLWINGTFKENNMGYLLKHFSGLIMEAETLKTNDLWDDEKMIKLGAAIQSHSPRTSRKTANKNKARLYLGKESDYTSEDSEI